MVMVRLVRRLVIVSLPLGSLVSPTAALADEASKAAAESLFQDGRRLMREGNFTEACPKLAESNRLDPGVGTLLYLGECYERGGRTATAWATFREAQGAAAAAKQPDRETAARKRADALEAKLVRLTVRLSAPVPGIEVRLDGNPMSAALVGTAIAVDPGAHVVSASAPGRVPWSETVQMTATRELRVPDLAQAPAPVTSASAAPPPPPPSAAPIVKAPEPPARAAPPPEDAPWPTTKKAAVVAGGIGVVGVLAGSYFGLRAFGAWSDSKDHCVETKCTDQGLADVDRAKSSATLSNVFLGIGVAGLGAATVLWLTSKETTVGLGVSPGGIALKGAF